MSEEKALPTAARWQEITLGNGEDASDVFVQHDEVERFEDKDEFILRKDVEALIRAIFRDSFKPCLNGEANELRNGADREEVAEQLDYYAEKFEEELLDEVQNDES